MSEMKGQNVAVIGAGSGIGAAIAMELAQGGARIFCLDINLPLCQDVTQRIVEDGGEAIAMQLDIADPNAVDRAVRQLLTDASQLHALVNCAGITGDTGMQTHEVDLANFDLVYRVNLRGALLLSQATIPHMVENGYGRVLHIASIAGKEGNPGMAAYSASKSGLIGLVKTMGKEYAQSGVTINALAPAVIRTPLVDAMPRQQVDYMTAKIPMGRLGTLTEVARMASWIVSPDCSFTTGFTFDLTGGRAVY